MTTATAVALLKLIVAVLVVAAIVDVALTLNEDNGRVKLKLRLSIKRYQLGKWWTYERARMQMGVADLLPRWLVLQCVIKAYAETVASPQHAKKLDTTLVTACDVIEYLSERDDHASDA